MSKAVTIEYKFRERLDELMSENRINQKDLAEKIGFSRKTINEYLNGKSCPDEWHLRKLASFFSVFPEYLSGESKYKNAGHMADQKMNTEEKETLIRHLEMLRYFNTEFGLDDYDHGKMTVLESHTGTETIDGKEIEVQCIDDFEDDYSKLIKDIEEYVVFKTKQFKDTHTKVNTSCSQQKKP